VGEGGSVPLAETVQVLWDEDGKESLLARGRRGGGHSWLMLCRFSGMRELMEASCPACTVTVALWRCACRLCSMMLASIARACREFTSWKGSSAIARG